MPLFWVFPSRNIIKHDNLVYFYLHLMTNSSIIDGIVTWGGRLKTAYWHPLPDCLFYLIWEWLTWEYKCYCNKKATPQKKEKKIKEQKIRGKGCVTKGFITISIKTWRGSEEWQGGAEPKWPNQWNQRIKKHIIKLVSLEGNPWRAGREKLSSWTSMQNMRLTA